MKIALFTETYLPYINGVVTHVKSLKDGLERAGHKVLVVTADTQARHHRIEDGVLWCPAMGIKKFYSYGLASPISLKRLRLIKNFGPDVIHIHNEFGIGFSGVSIARILRVPMVYTLHTMYDDYLYYVAPRLLIPIVRKIAHTYMKVFTNNASAITGPSKKVQEFINECGIERKVDVIPNPVELDKFNPDHVDAAHVESIKAEYSITEEDMVVSFCGRLGKEKSVDVLLNFFAEQYQPEDRMKLMIIGDGPAREELIEQARDLGIADHVIFTGKVDHDRLMDYYACCELYATTSLSDTNSISMLEAMATGLPVLHLKDELNAGQVVDGVNGYIFRDSKEMYEAMQRYRDLDIEHKTSFRNSVMQSVKKSGQENLAAYLLNVYTHIEKVKSLHRHVSIFEIKYKG